MRLTLLTPAALLLVALTASHAVADDAPMPTPLAATRTAPAYTQVTPTFVVSIRSRPQRRLERLGRVLQYYMSQKYSSER